MYVWWQTNSKLFKAVLPLSETIKGLFESFKIQGLFRGRPWIQGHCWNPEVSTINDNTNNLYNLMKLKPGSGHLWCHMARKRLQDCAYSTAPRARTLSEFTAGTENLYKFYTISANCEYHHVHVDYAQSTYSLAVTLVTSSFCRRTMCSKSAIWLSSSVLNSSVWCSF